MPRELTGRLFDDGDDEPGPALEAPGGSAAAPLAERMRPRDLDEFVGQVHLVGEGGSCCRLIEGRAPSLLDPLGRPGTGKTTLGAIARPAGRGAVHGHLRGRLGREGGARRPSPRPSRPVAEAAAPSSSSTRSIDSTRPSRTRCCRPSRTGPITLIGATTENPSFEVNAGPAVALPRVLMLASALARRTSRRSSASRPGRRRCADWPGSVRRRAGDSSPSWPAGREGDARVALTPGVGRDGDHRRRRGEPPGQLAGPGRSRSAGPGTPTTSRARTITT